MHYKRVWVICKSKIINVLLLLFVWENIAPRMALVLLQIISCIVVVLSVLRKVSRFGMMAQCGWYLVNWFVIYINVAFIYLLPLLAHQDEIIRVTFRRRLLPMNDLNLFPLNLRILVDPLSFGINYRLLVWFLSWRVVLIRVNHAQW